MSSSRGLRHYVNYHNSDAMQVDFADLRSFAIGTNKRIRDLVGDRVWMIGRREGTSDFYLYGAFRVEKMEPDPDRAFRCRASAARGEWIEPPVKLNAVDWFPTFKAQMANFSLGFQRITDEAVIAELQRIREAAGKATISADSRASP